MKSDFVICVDMDDTIENLCDAWVKWLNNKYGLNVNSRDVVDWDMSKVFTSLTKHQIYEPLYIDDFWYSVEPKKDAIEYLKKLYDDGFSIYLCTSAHYCTTKPKMEAIVERYFPFIDWKHIITCTNKQMIKCDVLVDDGTHNVLGGEYKAILMDAPYNRWFDNNNHGIQRVDNWKDVYDIINDMYIMKYDYNAWLEKNYR